jgi:hypothetical protein
MLFGAGLDGDVLRWGWAVAHLRLIVFLCGEERLW